MPLNETVVYKVPGYGLARFLLYANFVLALLVFFVLPIYGRMTDSSVVTGYFGVFLFIIDAVAALLWMHNRPGVAVTLIGITSSIMFVSNVIKLDASIGLFAILPAMAVLFYWDFVALLWTLKKHGRSIASWRSPD